MGAKLMKSESAFSFHLDGGHEMDAELLANTISEMAKVTKLAAHEINPEAYLKMNVTAFRDGSFQIDFSAICEVANNFIAPLVASGNFAKTVVDTVKGFLEIKKFLKGKLPKNTNSINENVIEIENSDGKKIKVPKDSRAIIFNETIDQSITNITYYVQEHNPNGGFQLSTESGDFSTTSEDIKSMSRTLPVVEETNCRRYKTEANLVIKKADILGRSKWSFKYNGQTIEARINDDDFIERIHNGATLKAGDYITATLEVYYDLDTDGKAIEGTQKYSVIKVHGSINHDYMEENQIGI